jgi:hypothetical protein
MKRIIFVLLAIWLANITFSQEAGIQTAPFSIISKKDSEFAMINNQVSPAKHKSFLLLNKDAAQQVSMSQKSFGSAVEISSEQINISGLALARKKKIGKSISYGALAGAIVGGIIGIVTYNNAERITDSWINLGAGLNIFAGSLIGAITGGLVGFAIGSAQNRFQSGH